MKKNEEVLTREEVTKECKIELHSKPGGRGCYIDISHKGSWLLEMGLEKTRVATHRENYRFEDGGVCSTPNTFHYFKIMRRKE